MIRDLTYRFCIRFFVGMLCWAVFDGAMSGDTFTIQAGAVGLTLGAVAHWNLRRPPRTAGPNRGGGDSMDNATWT